MTKVKTNSKTANSQIVLFTEDNADLIHRINQDGEMISLTDLWKEAGSPKNKDPRFWLRQDQTVGFISALTKFLNVISNHLIKIKRGKGGGTYAHKQIALEYAQYLDQRLGVLVNENFFQRVEEEKNPDLLVDRYQKAYRRQGKSDAWIGQRAKSRIARNQFTKTLAAHGVIGDGYKNCTNAPYNRLYGGSAAVVRTRKGLAPKQNIRDNMSATELAAVELIELLSAENIESHNLYGNGQCEMACTNVSKSVVDAIKQSRRSPF